MAGWLGFGGFVGIEGKRDFAANKGVPGFGRESRGRTRGQESGAAAGVRKWDWVRLVRAGRARVGFDHGAGRPSVVQRLCFHTLLITYGLRAFRVAGL